jgi:NAD(P)H-dependent FMN reductase
MSTSSRPKIGIVLSSTRESRFADRPAQWLLDIARARDESDYEIVDLRDYPMPFFDAPASPYYVPPTNPVAIKFGEKMKQLDGYVFITAEYNRAIPGVLKNALDHLSVETARKPAAFFGYGSVVERGRWNSCG